MNNEFNTNNKETVDKMIIRYAEVLLSYAEALYELNGAISNMKLNETVNEVRRRSGFMASLTNEFAQANGLCVRDEIRRERMVEFCARICIMMILSDGKQQKMCCPNR